MDGPAQQAVVSLTDVSMAFGTNRVLSGVSMSVRKGLVQALIGANGAGKSTLIKILSGVYPDHGGEIHVDGNPVRIDSPSVARSLGIHTVHQRTEPRCDCRRTPSKQDPWPAAGPRLRAHRDE